MLALNVGIQLAPAGFVMIMAAAIVLLLAWKMRR